MAVVNCLSASLAERGFFFAFAWDIPSKCEHTFTGQLASPCNQVVAAPHSLVGWGTMWCRAQPLPHSNRCVHDLIAVPLPCRDFGAYIRACEKHGRENIRAITAEVDGKTQEEVAAYSKVCV